MHHRDTHPLYTKLFDMLRSADTHWQQRKRKITTASVFAALCSASLNRRGFEHILKADDSSFTAQAVGKARDKLPQDLFRDINRRLQTSDQRPRVFAIDGSKVHVHPCFMKHGYKTRTNDKPVSRPAIRPLCMLSSMLDVHTRTCYDSVVSAHFNERASAQQHFEVTRPGDMVIFDRGYFSKALLRSACDKQLRVVFRLKCDAFKAAKAFFNSSRTFQKAICEGVDDDIFLHKYFIDGHKYMCLTNFASTSKDIKALYALRWRVETSFRRLKTDLNLEVSHSMSPSKYIQELQARVLYDTLSMLTRDGDASEKSQKRSKASVDTYLWQLDVSLHLIYCVKVCHELHLKRSSFWRVVNISSSNKHRATGDSEICSDIIFYSG
jgi:hypothetical protein